MRTLALLAALLLLALQAQAEPLPEKAKEAPDQKHPEQKDKAMVISFRGVGRTALQAAGLRKAVTCVCRAGRCGFLEGVTGVCVQGKKLFLFCCR